MTMGAIIKNHRLRLGLSQQALGSMVGVNKAAVQKWESGTVKNIKHTTIQQLSNIFDITPSDLMGFEEQQNTASLKMLSSINKLTQNEQALVSAYRAHPEMHDAVHRLLGISENEPPLRIAAAPKVNPAIIDLDSDEVSHT